MIINIHHRSVQSVHGVGRTYGAGGMGRCTFKYYSNMESLIIQGVLFSVYYWYEMIGKQDVRVFTARQRSCGKVLFHRCLSVILFEGAKHQIHHGIGHMVGYPQGIRPRAPPSDPWTPMDIRPGEPLSSDIWWWSLETCSKMFIWWPLKLKHVVSKRAVRILLEFFLVLT